MTSTSNRLLTLTAILLLAAFTTLSGCGQKGPLYLPKEEAQPKAPAAAAAMPAAEKDTAEKTEGAK
jgi:predicted small lipoprotein YifL